MDMIDEKKIEEAADKYVKETCTEDMSPVTKVTAEMSFHKGINWFLDNLWHDASEEPERDRDILLEYENGHPSDVRMRLPYQYENIYSSLCEKYWSAMVKIEKITRWLYIDDLLPKQEGGEQ